MKAIIVTGVLLCCIIKVYAQTKGSFLFDTETPLGIGLTISIKEVAKTKQDLVYLPHQLYGQTWTNFGDVNVSPNTLDLEGPNSMPALRVAQIRWHRQITDKWNLLLAIEEPKADYTPLDSANQLKSAFPELVVKPKISFQNGNDYPLFGKRQLLTRLYCYY